MYERRPNKIWTVLSEVSSFVGNPVYLRCSSPGVEALLNTPPDIFIDTMGYAFTLPLFKVMYYVIITTS